MIETQEKLAHLYAGMTADEQVGFLVRVCFEFSLVGRTAYAAGSDAVQNPILLRKANEAQNRVLSQLGQLLEQDSKRYPDDVFANILADQCRELRVDLDWLLTRTGISNR